MTKDSEEQPEESQYLYGTRMLMLSEVKSMKLANIQAHKNIMVYLREKKNRQ